jgi:type IV secretion system protein VirB9
MQPVKHIIAAVVSVVCAASVFAANQATTELPAGSTITVSPLAENPLPPVREKAQAARMSPRERAVLEAVKKWEREGVADALVGPGGEVQLAYGYSRPTISCAPLHVCTVKLIEGESIVSLGLGDTVRWLVQQTTAGDTPVVLIKPTQAGISTNLVISTSAGRVYYLHLVASKTEYVPVVSFYDPDAMLRSQTAEAAQIERLRKRLEAAEAEARAAREEAERRAREHKERTVVAEMPTDIDLTKLDFGMTCEPNSRAASEFVPTRIFASKTHTYIQLPEALEGKEVPAVFAKQGAQLQLLNVRRSGQYIVVDGRPSEISLALDVGDNARIVDCRRK